MKQIFIYSIAVAGLILAGCNKEATLPAVPEQGRTVTVSASTEDLTTRVSGSSKGKFTWQKGDVIGVWTGSELTPFTLDNSYNGLGYGKFTGTLPEGGAINENSFAVYPYDGVTVEGTTVKFPEYGSWSGYKTKSIFLYSKTAPTVGEDGIASFKFQHLTGYFRVTLKNIAVSAKALFLECYCPNAATSANKYFYMGGSADMSAETPDYGGFGTGDWFFLELPEHTSVIESLVLTLPVVPGNYGTNAKFRICATKAASFGNEMDGCNFDGFLELNINAGDYFVFPDIVFPNEKSADDTGSGVNDGIEDAVVNEQGGDGFWRVG